MADKYLDLSGLQAFYDELTGTYNSAFTTADDPKGKYPMQTSAISIALGSVATSAMSGWSAYSAVTANSATWATDTNKIADMTDVSTYFDGTSAIYAKSATSATSAASASRATSATKSNSAGKLSASRNIAASGDVTWTVSFDGSTGVTGNATINSVPGSAIPALSWSAISGLTGSGDQTNKIITPSAVDAKIAAAMTEKAAFKGPYATLANVPSSALDHLSIFLIGPTGTGTDQYLEYILPSTGTTTADFLCIGDTTTDLSDYLKTSSFTAWSGVTGSLFSGTSRSAQSAKSATSALSASNAAALGGVAAANVTGSATSGAAASAWVTAHSGDYALSSHDHGYKISANTTAFDVSSNVRFSAGSNIALTSAGVGVIGISGATIGNATISIATGASPATGTFTVNATSNKTITLGSMALAQTSAYMATGSMVPYTSGEVTTGISW